LIPSPEECQWSRAGRTDKGVSGFGQVVSLWVKSKLPKGHPNTLDWEAIKGLKSERSQGKDTDTNLEEDSMDEYPYLEILNRLLPEDIRVLAWTPVPTEFDARFSCRWRLYKYFFPTKNLDLERMKTAASLFVGTHDCRYICKLDPTKVDAPNYFIRDIYEAQIELVNPDFAVFVVRGRAFLWHQVRNMMALLFMVGKGLEEPQVITKMLNPGLGTNDAGKPNYDMAPDAPLVLIECGFEGLQWRITDGGPNQNHLKTFQVIQSQWSEQSLKVLQLETLRDEFIKCSPSLDFSGGLIERPKSHVALLKRTRADSVSVLQSKLAAKKKNKLNSESDK
jgi:tRNA pseudouridine38/39 synthase